MSESGPQDSFEKKKYRKGGKKESEVKWAENYTSIIISDDLETSIVSASDDKNYKDVACALLCPIGFIIFIAFFIAGWIFRDNIF